MVIVPVEVREIFIPEITGFEAEVLLRFRSEIILFETAKPAVPAEIYPIPVRVKSENDDDSVPGKVPADEMLLITLFEISFMIEPFVALYIP